MIARERRWILFAALFVALAIAAITGAHTEHRVTHDAAFCTTSCHHKDDLAAGKGAHAKGHEDIACQGCHATPARDGIALLWQSITHKNPPARHGKVDPRTCASCHEKNPAKYRLVAETQGHREHRSLKNVDCLSCHANDAHTGDPPEKVCTKCHADEHLHKATTMGAETCLSCHSFVATPSRAPAPTTVTCEKCHADPTSSAMLGAPPMKQVNEHALHGDVACQLCHNAHGKKPKPPEGQPVCARCHQFDTFMAGKEQVKGPEEHRNCEGCHKPHAPLKSAMQNCVNCHEKNAKGIAKGVAGATAALKHESCASCHLPHSWKDERSGCMQCHSDKATLLLTRSPPQHDACTNCHEVHGPPPTGAVCVSCHAKTKGNHVARAPQRHKDCTSCHNPHAPLPQDTRTACAKCHATELTQVMRDGPDGHAKDSCFGCHKPHDDPRPPADICAKCHAERAKVVSTASPPKHRTCTSCHETHKFKVTDVASTCAKCHGQMFGAENVPHQGECKSCHTLHGSPGVAKATCLGCHQKVAGEFKPPNEKHAVCRSCHTPHKPAATARASCAGCHEQKALVATKWPSNSAHAQGCTNCHQQHDVRNKKTCATCHAQETASAAGSKHRCQQCHAPHDAPPGTGAAWWTRCQQCHAQKAETVKERGPVHSDCKNCHQQHKFAVPTCTSCHSSMSQKGLHAVDKHAANCNACHDPHVKAEPTRAQCLTCHTDRVKHEPNAQKCQACHMFK